MLKRIVTNIVKLNGQRPCLLMNNLKGSNCLVQNVAFNFSQRGRDYTPSNKKYLQPWELERKEYVELSLAIQSAYSCKMLSEILKDNLYMLTDYQLSFAMFHLWNHEIPIDNYFYNVISPILKEYITRFDRECNKSLAEIATFLGRMKVQDDALWKVIETKLVQERLYRYIPLNDLIDLAHGMATANRGSQEFYNIVENVIIKHRLRLIPDKIAVAKDFFTARKIGSPLLFQVLENPHAEANELAGLKEREQLQISG
ncbi:hypothetical protein ABPG72_010140 [Tetrahymena utriculariae]